MGDISENELKKWVDILMEPEFLDKQIIMKQLQASQMYVKERYDDACFVGFHIGKEDVKKYPHKVTVPVSMVIYKGNGVPIAFQLFLSEGFIDEIEIVAYDFLELSPAEFDFSKREYRIYETVRV